MNPLIIDFEETPNYSWPTKQEPNQNFVNNFNSLDSMKQAARDVLWKILIIKKIKVIFQGYVPQRGKNLL